MRRAVDPEEAFVAALSSCHMLTFLYLAAKRGFIIDDYRDEAIGEMKKDPDGKMAMTTVTLRPIITVSGRQPSHDEFEALHHQAHDDSLNALAEQVSYTDEAGDEVEGTAWEEPNPYLADDVVTPLLPTLITRQATLAFARDLENLAAGTYTEVTGLLTESKFRKEMMNIGSVEARHAAAISIALGEPGAPTVFVNTKDRLPDTALIAATDDEEEAKAEGGEAAAG